MNKSKMSVFLGGMLLLGVAGVSTDTSAAPAVENVLMPGLNCRYYGTLGSDTYFNPSGYSANGLKNTSGSAKYLACPISKDTSGDTDIAWALITDVTASCELWARGTSGTTHWSTTSVDYVEPGYYRYTFDAATAFATSSNSATIFCSIPASAALINYFHNPV